MRRALLCSVVVLGGFATISTIAESPKAAAADMQKVLEMYKAALPASEAFALFSLDWMPTLDAAKKRAESKQRPILLIVVTNSYGDLYTGHC